MKLFIRPGACSLVADILLREVSAEFDLVEVDLATKRTAAGEDFLAINPKGQVPALVLDDGWMLTEISAIAQYLAEQHPQAELLPPEGDDARYRILEWMSFLATEVHKSFSPLMRPSTPEEAKPAARALVERKLDYVERHLGGLSFLVGDRFSPPDAYLFVLTSWCPRAGIDASPWPHIGAFRARLAARPSVRSALTAEGLA